ncbi:transposase [Streptomyces venezuelae]|uniref:Putative IS1648 transposase n=1 Tax=Streptomyces venezuelae (strain ATCC 10712 / CBS 650.69 / DSM 40230 / JCM 4526 / NBRC 13096 / PD 04745) TaxID=953739 RepID=F2R0Z0_STRVP|nr:hypothetical protein DEJ43_11005 [Streptomyces venezuelae ATCC 10712]CCA55507.1 putative IS1648 transposase [Streptomyces venezuelae ATCC 10712]
MAADKAYSNGPCRDYLRRRDIRHTIPEKTDSRNKLKHARAVATRYDKRGYVYLGTVTFVALAIWLRT